jgi:DNA-3-methyladenine glycosylase II
MPPRHARAIAHLIDVDPVLGQWIQKAGPCSLSRERDGTHFSSLARSIVHQQLSGKAAATIHGRFEALFGDRSPTPRELMKTQHAKLRVCGLSDRKAEYLRGLAEMVDKKRLPLEKIDTMPDDEVIDALTQVRGIGEWTAQMFLMFRLGRMDVLPVLDLGVQNAIKKIYGLRKHPTPDKVAKVGAKWAPYRTVASWYLWRIVDNPPQ